MPKSSGSVFCIDESIPCKNHSGVFFVVAWIGVFASVYMGVFRAKKSFKSVFCINGSISCKNHSDMFSVFYGSIPCKIIHWCFLHRREYSMQKSFRYVFCIDGSIPCKNHLEFLH